jgi:hypothetical protein
MKYQPSSNTYQPQNNLKGNNKSAFLGKIFNPNSNKSVNEIIPN